MKDITYGDRAVLDEKDKKIIEALYKNGRTPVSEISRKTGIRRDIIVYRLKKLLERDVISLIMPILNPPKLGYPNITSINMSIQNFDKKTEEEFIGFVKGHPNIIYFALLSGRWDYNIVVASRNPEHFNNTMKEIRCKFSNFIKDYDVSTIIKEPKYEDMLKLI